MRRRTQFTITGLGALIAAVFVVFALDADDQFVYVVTRLVLSLIGFVACSVIFVEALQRVGKMSSNPEQRLRMAAIVLLLAEISALLAIGAVLTWNDPLPDNHAAAIIGMLVRGSLAYGASIIAVTQSDTNGREITIDADTYAEFSTWKRQKGRVEIDREEYNEFLAREQS